MQQQQIQQQSKEQQQVQVPHQPQFTQNFIPSLFPQPSNGGNFQPQMFTTQIAQPPLNAGPIYAPSPYGIVPHPGSQQQNEMRPNVYSQVQQQLNPDFVRALQQQMSAQVQVPNHVQQTQQHTQQTIALHPGMKVVAMNGVNANNMVGTQPPHLAIQTSLAAMVSHTS